MEEKPTCENCERHCCESLNCAFLKNKKCIIYESRPLKCKTFPLYYNPYKEEVEALMSCPRWQEFKELAKEDQELRQVVINMHRQSLREV